MFLKKGQVDNKFILYIAVHLLTIQKKYSYSIKLGKYNPHVYFFSSFFLKVVEYNVCLPKERSRKRLAETSKLSKDMEEVT